MSSANKQRMLFVSDHGYFPGMVGGREASIHELSLQISNAGHHVGVLVQEQVRRLHRAIALMATMTAFPRSLFASRRRRSRWDPTYRIYRRPDVAAVVADVVKRGRYDFAVLQFDGPHRKIDFQASVADRYVLYIRDAEDVHEINANSFPAHVPLIANSGFVARKLATKTGRAVSTLIPYVEKTHYATNSRGRFVTFINPVPKKGLELAIEIARKCPEIPFLFVEGWPQPIEVWQGLEQRIAAVPNITLRRSVSDMRQIYSQTRVLLVPSQWEEAWARVVTEGHFSGIPVLARDIGGLGESVGGGGILIPPSAPSDQWAEELRLLYLGPERYRNFVARARDQAQAYWMKAQGLPGALLECSQGAIREIR